MYTHMWGCHSLLVLALGHHTQCHFLEFVECRPTSVTYLLMSAPLIYSSIFKDINKEVELKLHDHGVLIYSVDDKGYVKRVERTIEETDCETTASDRHLHRHQSTLSSSGATLSRRGTLNRLVSMVFPEKKQSRGIVVNCNDVECIFEFKVYEYCGRYFQEDQPHSSL